MIKARTINLRVISATGFFVAGSLLLASQARAELRCDCSEIVATCFTGRIHHDVTERHSFAA